MCGLNQSLNKPKKKKLKSLAIEIFWSYSNLMVLTKLKSRFSSKSILFGTGLKFRLIISP